MGIGKDPKPDSIRLGDRPCGARSATVSTSKLRVETFDPPSRGTRKLVEVEGKADREIADMTKRGEGLHDFLEYFGWPKRGCDFCNRAFDEGETVYRLRFYRVGGIWPTLRFAFVLACADCAKDNFDSYYGFDAPEPCEQCGRPVIQEMTRHRRKHTLCSDYCQTLFHVATSNARAKQARRKARGDTRECVVCSEVFEPARADSRYCSSPCRQKAYRRRVTDNKCCVNGAFDNRNGHAV